MRIGALTRFGAASAGVSLLVAGCSSSSSSSAASPAATAAPPTTAQATTIPPARTLTVFLAGSLSESFAKLGHRFETDNPGVTVKFNSSGPASDLAKQIIAGTEADVFASAGDAPMKAVTGALKVDGQAVIFATNVLEIATAPGNPKGIASFADLAKPDLKVVVCEPAAACGAAAIQVEQAAGVVLKPTSEEASLKAVLAKVTGGGADAGLVYATDVVAAKDTVVGVMFPESAKATTNYPIAVVKGAPQPELAKRFVELVTGAFGQTTLKAAGFGTK